MDNTIEKCDYLFYKIKVLVANGFNTSTIAQVVGLDENTIESIIKRII